MNKIIGKPPFPRRQRQRAALAALIVSLLLPGAAAAEAARVTFAHGAVAATATDGARRVLRRGSEIDAGDTISTGRGRAQLRFTDGSFVSLKPQTEFRVDEYAFKGAEEPEQRGFFSLLRGGLRTITGFIGRARKANYRMKTAVATIGIRGTAYNLDLLTGADGQPLLQWNVADDGESAIVLLLDNGQQRVVPWGKDGRATREQFEQLVTELQDLAADGQLQDVSAEEVEEVFAAGEVVDSQGRPALLADLLTAAAAQASTQPRGLPLAPPPDCGMAVPACSMVAAYGAFLIESEGAFADAISDGGEGIQAQFNLTTGALLSYTDDGFSGLGNGGVGTARAVVDGSAYFSVDPANPQDPRTIATWGRWVAPPGADGVTTGVETFPHPLLLEQDSEDTFAYAVSIPPVEVYNTGTAQYGLAGFTRPAVFTPNVMMGDGAAALGAPGAVTGSLTANFDAGNVSLNMNVPFANGGYNVNAANLGLFNGGFTETIAADNGAFFGGGLTVNGTGVACGGANCGPGSIAAGNLFGPRADGAALGYALKDPVLQSDITGAAVFKQQSCVGCEVLPVDIEIININTQ